MYPEESLHISLVPGDAVIGVIVVTGSIVVEDEVIVEVVLLESVELGPK